MPKAKDYGQQASFVQVLGEPENSPIRSVFDRVAERNQLGQSSRNGGAGSATNRFCGLV